MACTGLSTARASSMSKVFAEARRLVAADLSVIPIAADGSKRPLVSWKPFQRRRPTVAQLMRSFASDTCGLAIIGGDVSGGLEVLDFDAAEVFDPWCAMVEGLAPGLLGTPTTRSNAERWQTCPLS